MKFLGADTNFGSQSKLRSIGKGKITSCEAQVKFWKKLKTIDWKLVTFKKLMYLCAEILYVKYYGNSN